VNMYKVDFQHCLSKTAFKQKREPTKTHEKWVNSNMHHIQIR
jgi:hypothetical protein